MRFGEIIKGQNGICWIFHSARVVGAHQHNGLGAISDTPGRLCGIGDHISFTGQRAATYAAHVQPHFVIEIKGGGQNDLVTIAAQRGNGRAEGLIASGCYRHLRRCDVAMIQRACVTGQFFAQGRQPENRPIKMGVLFLNDLGHMRPQRRRRRGDRRGLADVYQSAL